MQTRLIYILVVGLSLAAAVLRASAQAPANPIVLNSPVHQVSHKVKGHGGRWREFFSLSPQIDSYVLCRYWVDEKRRIPNGSDPAIDYSGYSARFGTNLQNINWQVWIDGHDYQWEGGRELIANFGAVWIRPDYTPALWRQNSCTGKLPPIETDHQTEEQVLNPAPSVPVPAAFVVATTVSCLSDATKQDSGYSYGLTASSTESCRKAADEMTKMLNATDICAHPSQGVTMPDHAGTVTRLATNTCPAY